MANSTHICQILTMTRHASDEKRDLDDQRSNVVVESYQFGTVLPFLFFPSQTKKSNSSNPKPGENKSSKQKTLWSTASCPWKLFIVHVCKLLQQCNRIKQNILQKQLISLWSSHVVQSFPVPVMLVRSWSNFLSYIHHCDNKTSEPMQWLPGW